MVVGVNGVKAQETPDYAGTYFVRSESVNKQTSGADYYLCPTEGWAFYDPNGTNMVTSTVNGQPFLTTHQIDQNRKYKWIVEKHVVNGNDYYSFRYGIDYNEGETQYRRYLSYSLTVGNATVDRMRVHLEKIADPDVLSDNELFSISPRDPYIKISPKNTDADDGKKTKYLVVNGGNKDSFKGESGKTGGPTNYGNTAGIIGTYYDANDANNPFSLIPFPTCTAPEIEYIEDAVNGDKIRISCTETDATVYYTQNGSDPSDSNNTPFSFNTGTQSYVEFPIGGVTEVKAYTVKDGEGALDLLPSNIVSLNLGLMPPVISYDAVNNKVIITCRTAGATIYYTTGETSAAEPTVSSGTVYNSGNEGFVLPDNINVIRAISAKESEVSDEVQLTITIHASTTGHAIPYCIQSVESTDFYMIPGDKVSNKTYSAVTTSSLPEAAMEWYFYGDEESYFYIQNKATEDYLCYNSSDGGVCLHKKATFEAAANKNNYKFSIHYANTTSPGYYIHPKSNSTATNGLSKKGGNNAVDVLTLQNATLADYKYARWNFIRSTVETKPTVAPPFVVWGAGDQYKYYKIKKDNSNFVAPRREGVSYAIPSSSDADNLLWYFDEADHTDWVTYYYIVNATTGEYLYFGGSDQTSNNNNAFIAKQTLGTDVERYQFTFVKTTANDQYYILPRVLQNLKKNSYSLVFWDGYGTLSTKEERADAKAKWSFVVSDVTELCPPLITLEADGKVNMTSRTRGAVMSYKVGDASDYTTFSSNPIGSLSQ